MKRYIYSLDVVPGAMPETAADPAVQWAGSAGAVLRRFKAWNALLGTSGALRVLAQMCKGRREAALLVWEDKPAGYAVTTKGYCRHYIINKHDAVIGPVYVQKALRGQGLGRRLTADAVRRLSEQGWKRIWINTTEDNPGMLKIIARCGFKRACEKNA